MLKQRKYFIRALPFIIFIAITVFLWVGLHRNPREIPSPLLNKPAPAFQAPSLRSPQQDLSEKIFHNRVTILNVFATWCIACQAEHSVLMEGRGDLHGAQLIGLDYKDNRPKALTWLRESGDPYEQVIDDPQGNIAINFGVYGTPETFIIDQQGVIRYKFTGAISPADWKQTILPKIQTLIKND